MELKSVFNDYVVVKDVVHEYDLGNGLVKKSLSLANVVDEISIARTHNREQKLFVSDIVFEIVSVNMDNKLGLVKGDIIRSVSIGLKLDDFRVIREYDIICKM